MMHYLTGLYIASGPFLQLLLFGKLKTSIKHLVNYAQREIFFLDLSHLCPEA